ncbi:IclR family transcriptional regulator [Nitratireductor sp. XY-223]|uniref:IclR family transcriptional regulator n=1 Tax=Nitratireductor sp. XY-223 TaxID=2561926 RepID=UPI0010AA5A00|nr:IclR family transcriptional regulator [Nitratireductor sp. XY-223]
MNDLIAQDENEAGSGTRIATNLRTLLILEILGRSDAALSPTEINRELGLPKQSIHRLCTTLVEQGFLVYETDGKKLRPARRLRAMASGILHASRVHIARHQILQDVAATVGETVNFVVPEEAGMSYKDRVETDWPFRVQLPIGTHVPFHCTASGKTFMSTLSPGARKVMVDSIPLEPCTPNTITDREKLLAELKQIARQGYALDREEFMEGMVAIAVPVRDRQNRFMAALAFHGPTVRLNVDNMLERKSVLVEAAGRLTQTLTED